MALMRLLLVARALIVGLVLCGVPAWAQGEAGPPPTGLVAPRFDLTGARFFWCAGVADQSDLPAYVAAGFDTLVIPLPWRAGADNALFDANFGPQRALAVEGAKRGLKIIFALPAAPDGLSVARIGADSPSYSALWTNWAQSAATALLDTPGLAGWMLPDDARAIATFDDAGFRRYLSSHFASVEALNARWGTNYADFDSVAVSDVDALVKAWRERIAGGAKGMLPALGSLGAESDPNAAFAPAALALADYKASSWAELMTLWAATVRGSDAKHPVFSGVCPDYAQLLAMPEGVDVAVAGASPNLAEPDIVTGNPQAVDIARRGGTRVAVARFSLAPRGELTSAAVAQLLPRWVEAALAHGARGIAFDSFGALERNPELLQAVSKTLARFRAAPLDTEAPLATVAVLLEPLAEGASPQLGQSVESAAPRGLYGFGDGLATGEPSNLVASLRWGTAFGSVDYLSSGDLASVDLSKYATILAPQMLDCPPDAAQKLTDWMKGGGVLVADLGLGALQNGGSASALPPQMALLAGGVGPFEVRQNAFNLRGAAGHPLLPTWSKMLDERPGMILSRGDGDDDSAFSGPVGFAPAPANAATVASGPSMVVPSGYGGEGTAAPASRVALSLAPVGRGFFVFAPFRLWATWRPGQFGFDPLFGDILARGANLAIGTDALTPFPAGTRLGTTRFPETINRPSSIAFLNHDAGAATRNVALDTTGTGDWLWSNALTRMLPASALTNGAARPSPVADADDVESRTRPLSLFSTVAAGSQTVCRMRPVAIQNQGGGGVTGQITGEAAGKLTLRVWGDTIQVAAPMNGVGWQPLAPDGVANFRVTVVDSPDGYRCPPRSRHRVMVTEIGNPGEVPKGKTVRGNGATDTLTVVADAHGRLAIEFAGAASVVTIEPYNGGAGRR